MPDAPAVTITAAFAFWLSSVHGCSFIEHAAASTTTVNRTMRTA
jgi:hypothetical protein